MKRTHIRSDFKCYYGHRMPLCINPKKQLERNKWTEERQKRGRYSCGCMDYYFAIDPANATCKYCIKKQEKTL